MLSSRLALGTVQFGLPYGFNQNDKPVGVEEVRSILYHASDSEVSLIDTAIDYGHSENCLGSLNTNNFNIVSKIPSLPKKSELDIKNWVRSQVEGSLKRLKKNSIEGMLLHRPLDLISTRGDELYRELLVIKEEGLIRKIGISIYSPVELDMLYEHFELDIVQTPFNLIDRRIKSSGWLSHLHQKGVEVHIRSIFLQGLLLLNYSNLPKQFHNWSSIWKKWDRWQEDFKISALDSCCAFSLSHPEVSKIVVGVHSFDQFIELTNAFNQPSELPSELPDIATNDENLINPAKWIS